MTQAFENAAEGQDLDPKGEFANVRSVSHLKHLLKNYKGLVEAQEAVIEGDIVSRSKVPPPDEIITPNSRFRIISDREIENMRARLEQQMLSLIHISEPTRPLYISYAVFCLKKKFF